MSETSGLARYCNDVLLENSWNHQIGAEPHRVPLITTAHSTTKLTRQLKEERCGKL